jgi:hypothetical protein
MNKTRLTEVFGKNPMCKIADELRLPNSTVQGWFNKSIIPAKYKRAILECETNMTAPESLRLVAGDL